MKAIVITSPGGPEVLQLLDVENPVVKDTTRSFPKRCKPDCSVPEPLTQLVKMFPGGKSATRVCALLRGGGHAEEVAVPVGQVLPVLPGISLKDTASFPEVACTLWSTVFMTSQLSKGETFLVHGGSSGIGVDFILDCMGAAYYQRNLESLSYDGRLFIIGFQGGTSAEVDLRALVAKRLTVQGAGLRNRSPENKAVIISEVEKHVWPAIAVGKVRPVVYRYFPLSEAADAHRLMESSQHVGKILLIP